jgi:hypothetical protein
MAALCPMAGETAVTVLFMTHQAHKLAAAVVVPVAILVLVEMAVGRII